jgi:hypothetical protein
MVVWIIFLRSLRQQYLSFICYPRGGGDPGNGVLVSLSLHM